MYDKRLDAIIKTAELGSFSKAANALGYTIPALVKQVNGLEQQTGVIVFERSNKGVNLTPAGRTLVEGARDIVERSNRVVKRARQRQDQDDGLVRVGVSLYQSGQPVLKLCQDLYLNGVDLRIQFVPVADTHESYLYTIEHFGDDIDVLPSTRLAPEDERNCSMIVLGNPFLCLNVALGDELASRDSVNVEELAGRRLLVPKPGNPYTDSARNEIAERAPGAEFSEFPFYTMEVFDRCAMGDEVLLSKEIWRGSHPLLATVSVNWSQTIPYCLYHAKEPSPAVRKFVQAADKLARSWGTHATTIGRNRVHTEIG
ncbi:MAG: LysR family transcriptional regulator [Eggerthellaceae bacterium]|nr:LysR family transcriptional regulator [Eggerthellaceae bacterium]